MEVYRGDWSALNERLAGIAGVTYPDDPITVSQNGTSSVVIAGPYVFKAPCVAFEIPGIRFDPRRSLEAAVQFEASAVAHIPDEALLSTGVTITTPRLVGSYTDVPDPYNIFTYVKGEQLTPADTAQFTLAEREQLGRDIGSSIVWLSEAVPIATYRTIQKIHHRVFDRYAMLRDYRLPHIDKMLENGCPSIADVVQETIREHESNFAHNKEDLIVCHGDLRLANLCMIDNRLAGLFDFGHMEIGTPADELAHTWRLGPAVINAAIWQYEQDSGRELSKAAVEHYALLSLLRKLSFFAIYRTHNGNGIFEKEGVIELINQLRPDKDWSEIEQFIQS